MHLKITLSVIGTDKKLEWYTDSPIKDAVYDCAHHRPHFMRAIYKMEYEWAKACTITRLSMERCDDKI